MPQDVQLITADVVCPISTPSILNGALAIADGRILAVGERHEIAARFPNAQTIELLGQALLPGLVNAHVHLELSNCVTDPVPDSFTDWLSTLSARMGPTPDTAAAVKNGVDQCLKFGITTVGDISQQSTITRRVLRNGPLRVTSFGEVLGIGATQFKVKPLLEQASSGELQTSCLRVGVSPHAPYSLDPADFKQVVDSANQLALPIATHLAELPYESEFLQRHTGPLAELFRKWQIFRDDIGTFAGDTISFANAVGLLNSRAVLAHVNYCSDAQLELLACGNASVVFCPRTHAFFNHPPHRWREMLERGVNVAIGTDSCASSPDLNLLDDLRLVYQQAKNEAPSELWKLVTVNGAKALHASDQVGALSAGLLADFVAFPIQSRDPLLEILETNVLPDSVWIAGQKMDG